MNIMVNYAESKLVLFIKKILDLILCDKGICA